MIIELVNVGTLNKGAYLMLKSIQQIFAKRCKRPVEYCANIGFGRTYFSLGANKIYQIPKGGKQRLPLNSILKLSPQKVRRELGIVLNSEVDHLLDSSGFAYGDFWGKSRPSKAYLKHIASVKKRGGKVILLPQALGPFTNPEVAENFASIANSADLIIARDKVSYNHLTGTYGQSDRYKLFPDFTNLLDTSTAREYDEGDVCIIPNYKMLKNKLGQETKYFNWLEGVCQYLISNGMKPYWLIHEGNLDREIAMKVNLQLAVELPIVQDHDPILIKHRIKSAKFIVVSRFHGLVSALSQGIPAISTSWSHKYRMLLEDYGMSMFLVDVFSDDETSVTKNLLDKVINVGERENISLNVMTAARAEKRKTEEMWNLVMSTLEVNN